MGRDKALLLVDDRPMAVRVAEALTAAGAARVVCVGGDVTALRALGLDAIADGHPDSGPLGGVLAALAWSDAPAVVIAPCDLVAPAAPAFAQLHDTLIAGAAAIAVPLVDGGWRPLPLAARPSIRRALIGRFKSGERALHRALQGLDRVDVTTDPFRDADVPDDLPGHR